MGCCGHKRRTDGEQPAAPEPKRERLPMIYPADGCVLCAEKHVSLAYALAGEAGYLPVNRQRIVGELGAAGLHLYREHPAMAEQVRALRHLIQQRREGEAVWAEVLADVDTLASNEINQPQGAQNV